MTIEEKLALNKYEKAEEPHITPDKDACGRCALQPCLFACPAGCFVSRDGHITFSHEGCLECGSCRVVCPDVHLRWDYPPGGCGICYQYG